MAFHWDICITFGVIRNHHNTLSSIICLRHNKKQTKQHVSKPAIRRQHKPPRFQIVDVRVELYNTVRRSRMRIILDVV
jgi:hypothetical protein